MEVCNAVLDVWQPTAQNKAIINIPATVETAMPHVFATQIEYVSKNLKYRDNVVLSLHPHNDRGCGISDAELDYLLEQTGLREPYSETESVPVTWISSQLP